MLIESSVSLRTAASGEQGEGHLEQGMCQRVDTHAPAVRNMEHADCTALLVQPTCAGKPAAGAASGPSAIQNLPMERAMREDAHAAAPAPSMQTAAATAAAARNAGIQGSQGPQTTVHTTSGPLSPSLDRGLTGALAGGLVTAPHHVPSPARAPAKWDTVDLDEMGRSQDTLPTLHPLQHHRSQGTRRSRSPGPGWGGSSGSSPTAATARLLPHARSALAEPGTTAALQSSVSLPHDGAGQYGGSTGAGSTAQQYRWQRVGGREEGTAMACLSAALQTKNKEKLVGVGPGHAGVTRSVSGVELRALAAAQLHSVFAASGLSGRGECDGECDAGGTLSPTRARQRQGYGASAAASDPLPRRSCPMLPPIGDGRTTTGAPVTGGLQPPQPPASSAADPAISRGARTRHMSLPSNWSPPPPLHVPGGPLAPLPGARSLSPGPSSLGRVINNMSGGGGGGRSSQGGSNAEQGVGRRRRTRTRSPGPSTNGSSRHTNHSQLSPGARGQVVHSSGGVTASSGGSSSRMQPQGAAGAGPVGSSGSSALGHGSSGSSGAQQGAAQPEGEGSVGWESGAPPAEGAEEAAARGERKKERAKAMSIMARSALRTWLNAHGKHLNPPKLSAAVTRVIRAWFELVDEDGSGGLDASELEGALRSAAVPCGGQSIKEMIDLMDLNKDGEISWSEFEAFLTQEFAAGKALLSGEYVLPSGTALPFGAMVTKMRRDRLMNDVIAGGEARGRLRLLAENETALKAELDLLDAAQREQDEYRRQTALRLLLELEEKEAAAAQASLSLPHTSMKPLNISPGLAHNIYIPTPPGMAPPEPHPAISALAGAGASHQLGALQLGAATTGHGHTMVAAAGGVGSRADLGPGLGAGDHQGGPLPARNPLGAHAAVPRAAEHPVRLAADKDAVAEHSARRNMLQALHPPSPPQTDGSGKSLGSKPASVCSPRSPVGEHVAADPEAGRQGVVPDAPAVSSPAAAPQQPQALVLEPLQPSSSSPRKQGTPKGAGSNSPSNSAGTRGGVVRGPFGLGGSSSSHLQAVHLQSVSEAAAMARLSTPTLGPAAVGSPRAPPRRGAIANAAALHQQGTGGEVQAAAASVADPRAHPPCPPQGHAQEVHTHTLEQVLAARQSQGG